MQNIYEMSIMDEFNDTPDFNPYYKKHNILLKKHGIILGGTGSGKTQALANMLMFNFNNTFREIIIYVANPDEPIYNMLAKKFGVKVYDLSVIKPASSLPHQQQMIVFDDFITIKDKNKWKILEDYATQARKYGASVWFLTQNWFSVPPLIRNQIRYMMILKTTNKKNLSLICTTLQIECTPEKLKEVIAYCTRVLHQVCFIDLHNSDRPLRRNFNEFIDIATFNKQPAKMIKPSESDAFVEVEPLLKKKKVLKKKKQ